MIYIGAPDWISNGQKIFNIILFAPALTAATYFMLLPIFVVIIFSVVELFIWLKTGKWIILWGPKDDFY